jgi:inosine-uridine nucleoside N-ribohydrolase
MRKLLALAAALCLGAGAAAQSTPVIFDTDMGNDVDDALALAMLHALESRGECRLIGVTITKDNPWAAPYVDLVNTFYGRAHIPVGMVKGGVTPEKSPLIQVPANAAGPTDRWSMRLASGSEAPEAVALLRRLLASEKDASVVVVQVGFSTNLARLLDDPADVELVRRKVKLLSVMAGNFAQAKPEFNVGKDTGRRAQVVRPLAGQIVVMASRSARRCASGGGVEKDFAWARPSRRPRPIATT